MCSELTGAPARRLDVEARRPDLSVTGIHNGFAPVSRLYRACITLYRGCIASLTQPVSHVSQVYAVSRCIAPLSRHYRATIAPLSRHYRATIASIAPVSRVSQCKIKFTSLTQIRGCLADSRVYRSVSRASRRLSRVYRGCIAAVSRLYRAVSRVSRRKIHMYRGCLASIAAVSQESHVVSHCESVMYPR